MGIGSVSKRYKSLGNIVIFRVASLPKRDNFKDFHLVREARIEVNIWGKLALYRGSYVGVICAPRYFKEEDCQE